MAGSLSGPAETTRFAPSPTGQLHLGHAYAALFAEAAAAPERGGRLLVRIEDIDAGRCRPEFIAGILEDLRWLGLRFAEPVRRQAEHLDDYAAALARLEAAGLIYPCFCTRAEILAEVQRSGGAPQGPEGLRYPGTCQRLGAEERARRRQSGQGYALRLDVGEALGRVAQPLRFSDAAQGVIEADPRPFGDVVLARKDAPTSYHLAVTVDDALQGVTLVTRGDDLLAATHVHRLLQALLGLPTPRYHHHRLQTDERGQRLAKRDRALTLRALREAGVTPAELRARLGFAS